MASGLAKLGTPVSFHGKVGEDEYGDFLLNDFKRLGVRTKGLIKDSNNSTGHVFAMIEPSGERTLIVCALNSSYTQLKDTDLMQLEEMNLSAIFLTGVLLVEEPSRSTLLNIPEHFKGRVKIYFDPNLRHPKDEVPQKLVETMQEVSQQSDVVLTGEGEAEALDLQPIEEQIFVIKCGANGARIETTSGNVANVEGHQVEVVDAIGAGDSFNAAFIAAQYRGKNDVEALTFANAAAALSVTQKGARSMPHQEEIERLIEK